MSNEAKISFRFGNETIVLRTDGSKPFRSPGNVTPTQKLVVERLPDDAMGPPPERIRLTAGGAFLTRAADGSVMNIVGFEADNEGEGK